MIEIAERIKFYNEDNLQIMAKMENESIDVILTDPPYLYLKNQKLERPFDEQLFFSECKRVLKKDGFIVLFGRGTSFYRWNTILDELGFVFKEEIIWNKNHCTSPLMNLSRVHETISIFTKGKGTINKVKVPYLEMKGHDLDAIITDINRLKTTFNNTKSLNAVLEFLENNKIENEKIYKYNEKLRKHNDNYNVVAADGMKSGDRSVYVLNAMEYGMSEKSIIRTDRYESDTFTRHGVTADKRKPGDRNVNVIQSMEYGMNEKSIIKEQRDHYATVHPTQKPVRLMERLLNLTVKSKDATIFDPFAGSCPVAIACHNLSLNFVGCEIDKEYFNNAVERLKVECSQQKINY